MKLASDLAIKLNIGNEEATAILANISKDPKCKYVILERLGLEFTESEVEYFDDSFERLCEVLEPKVAKPKAKRKPSKKKSLLGGDEDKE